ncbi:MAG: TonB-dependent receptor plug domain-containing protein, partial [Parvularcula sp.]|nr:TonB-dependent receptor plug domain-containing protein [Parvularcula sp.]
MKPNVKSAASLVALVLASMPAAFAQDEEGTGEEDIIVVYGSQVELNAPYAGGQVARGARAGLLGNLDFLDTPFSSTAYTAELIRDQQAVSIGDAVRNDPTVRVAKGFGNFQELFVLRGFPIYSDDMTYNGLYGVLPRQFVAAELAQRVEVFRGANAFLNGAAPGGSAVGGAINLVPKRAGDDDLNRLTAGFEGNGHLYGAADIGRRFGADDAFGVRVNAVRRDGETAVEDQDRELTVVGIGTDYA